MTVHRVFSYSSLMAANERAWANLGKRYCLKCEPRPHRVYMNFQQREEWHVSFSLLPDQKPLRRRLTFKATEKLFELARRTGASAEVLADLHRCITAWGRSTVTLHLTDAQLQVLGGIG